MYINSELTVFQDLRRYLHQTLSKVEGLYSILISDLDGVVILKGKYYTISIVGFLLSEWDWENESFVLRIIVDFTLFKPIFLQKLIFKFIVIVKKCENKLL